VSAPRTTASRARTPAPIVAPRPNPAWTRRASAAHRYQPKTIRLLLVVAAPPPEEDRYFYAEDGPIEEPLFEDVAQVLFEEPPRDEKRRYLKELRRRGVFLVELRPDAPSGASPMAAYVPWLVMRARDLEPGAVVALDGDAYGAIRAPMKAAGLPIVEQRIASTPGPEFRRGLRTALVKAKLETLIRPLPPSARGGEDAPAPRAARAGTGASPRRSGRGEKAPSSTARRGGLNRSRRGDP
jgi:hypothetical protein